MTVTQETIVPANDAAQETPDYVAEKGRTVADWADTEEECRFELATKETVKDLERWLTKRANEDKFEHAVFALVLVAYYAVCNIWADEPERVAEMYGVESGDATLSPIAVDLIVETFRKLNWFGEKDGELHVPRKEQAEEPQRPFWVKGLEGEVTVEVYTHTLCGDQRVYVREFPLPWRNFGGVYVRDGWVRHDDDSLDQEPHNPRYLQISTAPADGYVWHDWRRKECKNGPLIAHDVSLEYIQDAEIHRAKIIWDDDSQTFVIALP